MSELKLVRTNIEYNHSWGPGIHNDYVIHYILSGKGYFEVDNKKYELHAGESFFIFPGSIVNYYADIKEPWTYAWINFNGTEAKRLISMTAFAEHPVCPKTCYENIYRTFIKEIREQYTEIYNSGLLRILLSKYIKDYPSKTINAGTDYLHIAKQYIAANLHHREFTVNELSEVVGLERSYLYRLFKQSEGVSIIEYIINLRLENAKLMLERGITQIKLVSYSSGYDNPLYFSNAFKKKYGISPRNYIKSYLSKNETTALR